MLQAFPSALQAQVAGCLPGNSFQAPRRAASYQCAWNSAPAVAIPEINEPVIAIAAGMPCGNSRLISPAMKIAATGQRNDEIATLNAPDVVHIKRRVDQKKRLDRQA